MRSVDQGSLSIIYELASSRNVGIKILMMSLWSQFEKENPDQHEYWEPAEILFEKYVESQ